MDKISDAPSMASIDSIRAAASQTLAALQAMSVDSTSGAAAGTSAGVGGGGGDEDGAEHIAALLKQMEDAETALTALEDKTDSVLRRLDAMLAEAGESWEDDEAVAEKDQDEDDGDAVEDDEDAEEEDADDKDVVRREIAAAADGHQGSTTTTTTTATTMAATERMTVRNDDDVASADVGDITLKFNRLMETLIPPSSES